LHPSPLKEPNIPPQQVVLGRYVTTTIIPGTPATTTVQGLWKPEVKPYFWSALAVTHYLCCEDATLPGPLPPPTSLNLTIWTTLWAKYNWKSTGENAAPAPGRRSLGPTGSCVYQQHVDGTKGPDSGPVVARSGAVWGCLGLFCQPKRLHVGHGVQHDSH